MSENPKASGRGHAVLRWFVAAAFILAVAVSGLFSGLTNKAGLFFLVAGSVAAALMGFSRREIGAAFGHAFGSAGPRESLERSAYFWEAAVRNAWVLGVLGSALNFTMVLGGGDSGGIQDVSNRMIQSLVVTLYGLVLAVICLLPAIKLAAAAKGGLDVPPSGAGPVRPGLFGRLIGYVLFAAVLGLPIVDLVERLPQDGPFSTAAIIFHGPALLVVIGGTVALALFMGAGAGARSLTLGFALTGLISLLMGFIQALSGFVRPSIEEISVAIAFILSASMFALLGLVAVAGPLEDREVMEGRRRGSRALSRTVWIVFPLLTFIFLILTFIMVVTPMTKKVG
jgi:hypothetical protein